VNPNRISSSGRGRSDWFKLDQLRWPVRSGQHRTAVNCNPNCNPATASLAFWSVDSSAGARTRSDRFRDPPFHHEQDRRENRPGRPPRAGSGAAAERLVNNPMNFGYRNLGLACLRQVDAACRGNLCRGWLQG
jgi:hypothetical protein